MSDSEAPATPPTPVATVFAIPQRNRTVGAHDEFVLPDVSPIIEEGHTSRVGLVASEVWIRGNTLLIGIFGTLVDWFVFFAEIGKAYPSAAALAFAAVALPLEERYSEHPYVGNTIHYAMEVLDPVAAAKIYAPKEVDPDPVTHASQQILSEATATYLKSAEYAALKAEVEQDVQRLIRRNTYRAAGMTEEAAAVDAEIAAAHAEKASPSTP